MLPIDLTGRTRQEHIDHHIDMHRLLNATRPVVVTNSVQDAVDACPSGGTVYLPGNTTYALSADLTIDKPLNLIGEKTSVLRWSQVVNPAISITSSQVSIRNLTIKANGPVGILAVGPIMQVNLSGLQFASVSGEEFVAIEYNKVGVSSISDIRSIGGRVRAINGYTALTLERCYLHDCPTQAGFELGVGYYSALINCAVDRTLYGYAIGVGARGISMTSCGAEACGYSHSVLRGDAITLISCVGVGNGSLLSGGDLIASAATVYGRGNTIIGFCDHNPSDAGERTANIVIMPTGVDTSITGGVLDRPIVDLR